MKKLTLLSVVLLSLLSTGCQKHQHTYEISISKNANWRTYIAGDNFDATGLEIVGKCSSCGREDVLEYSLENSESLTLEQTSVKIVCEGQEIEYGIAVREKYHLACVGDSLTAGHNWANESYPSYLSKTVDTRYEVGNYGVNGISITGYGGSWDREGEEMRYIKQDVYKNCVKFAPDIFAIMLGTNDATGWERAEAKFVDYYKILLDSFKEQFPYAKYIMMVSPPTKDGNQFGIPNDTIRDKVNPIQRQLAEEYGFDVIDLRKEFEETENYESKYLRPNNDGVHFTKAAAQYVANRVWQVANHQVA